MFCVKRWLKKGFLWSKRRLGPCGGDPHAELDWKQRRFDLREWKGGDEKAEQEKRTGSRVKRLTRFLRWTYIMLYAYAIVDTIPEIFTWMIVNSS